MKKHMKNIVSLFLIFALVISLSGCGETKKAETAVNNTFTALKELNFETASDYINLDEIMKSDDSGELSDIDSKLFMENLFDKLEYEIVSSEKIDKNTVIVKTKITAVDMKPVLGEFFSKVLQYAFANAFASPQPSDEEMNEKMEEMFVECVSKEDLATVTKEIDIKVVKVGNNWKIEADDALYDALLGGMEEAAKEISDSFDNFD